jgi:aspartate carbamoyltransferase catalytic subunit
VIASLRGRDLLTLEGVSTGAVLEVLDTAEAFAEVNERTVRKVPTLRGRVVASLFFEESTRTRLSFETAAKRLSADVLSLAVAASSVKKGESLRDTIETIEALGIDAVVLRHASSGAAAQVARQVPHVRVINAGDGQHQHPTQGLLDAFTVRRALAERAGVDARASGASLFEGLRVLMVGDLRHSRVARSDLAAYRSLGATVRLAAPGTLLPTGDHWGVEVAEDLDEALEWADVVALLRVQRERGGAAVLPSIEEYAATFGLSVERARRLRAGALITHPGPLNRGVEVDSRVADSPASLVRRQVASGVAVRMAVLYLALAGAEEVLP